MAKPHPEVQNNLQSISVLGSPPCRPPPPLPPTSFPPSQPSLRLTVLEPPLAMRARPSSLTSAAPRAFARPFPSRHPPCRVSLRPFEYSRSPPPPPDFATLRCSLRLSRNPCRDQPASQYPTRSVLIRAGAGSFYVWTLNHLPIQSTVRLAP